MIDEELMLFRVKQLCACCGKGIDRISKECGINQNLVANLFMETMEHILKEIGGYKK